MRHLVAPICIMLTVFTAACRPQPEISADDVAEGMTVDIATLSAQLEAFVSAWNTGDREALAAGIAEDAVLMKPTATIIGRDAILADAAEAYDYSLMQQAAAVDEVLALGEYAYARGSWTLDPTDAASEVPAMSGQWSAVYKASEGGRWQTWRWMWNQPPEQVLAAMSMAE